MDDLISRAALLNDLSYCAPELWQDEEYIKAKIMKQPAIDAIQVEWLEHMMTATTLARTSNAIKDVLALWKRMGQKEQEAQDG